MPTPVKHHLLELHKHHLIEQVAFAREYGTDGFGTSEAHFPHSPSDVMAVTAMCFDYAGQVLDAAQTGIPSQVWEDTLVPSTDHVASVAARPWIALLREVERAESLFIQHLRATDDALLLSTPPTTIRPLAPVCLPYLPFNQYMYLTPVLSDDTDARSVVVRIAYLTTALPALVRACYGWNCGNIDLSLRMFKRACDRVEHYDKLHGLAMHMRYTLAQMYRAARRYIDAIETLRHVVVMDRTNRELLKMINRRR